MDHTNVIDFQGDKVEHAYKCTNICDVLEYSLESQCETFDEDQEHKDNYQVVSGVCISPLTFSSLSNIQDPLPPNFNAKRKTVTAWVR